MVKVPQDIQQFSTKYVLFFAITQNQYLQKALIVDKTPTIIASEKVSPLELFIIFKWTLCF